jgi:Holliday junction resolvase RusA-like endonuclease
MTDDDLRPVMPDPRRYEGAVGFRVRGTTQTQGSKRGFVQAGRVRMVESGGKGLTAWRHAIATEARAAMGDRPCIEGPVDVTAYFYLAKPASAPKRRRTWPIGARSGDVDKLARALLDGITGVCLRDDSQVVQLDVRKDWGDPGVEVLIRKKVWEDAA